MGEYSFIIVIAIFVSIVIIAKVFSQSARIKRKIKRVQFKKIANFKNGDIAKVVGNIEFIDTPLVAPLSNRKCAYYFIKVQKQQSSGKSSSWNTIIEENVSGKFLIKGDTHYALVNDEFIESYIVQDQKYSSGFLEDATTRLENYLNSKGHESEGFLGFNKTIRYKEGVLENGEEVAALGKGEWKEAKELNLPDSYGKILVLSSHNNNPVYLSDDPDTTIKKLLIKKISNKDYSNGKRYRK